MQVRSIKAIFTNSMHLHSIDDELRHKPRGTSIATAQSGGFLMSRPNDKPGTERHRDEAREGGPRMHGRGWHDHDEAHSAELESMAAPDAVPEVEAADERQGMGRHVGRGDKGASRVDQASPRGKGKPGIQKGADARPHGTGGGSR
jgi:hypothetical protein